MLGIRAMRMVRTVNTMADGFAQQSRTESAATTAFYPFVAARNSGV